MQYISCIPLIFTVGSEELQNSMLSKYTVAMHLLEIKLALQMYPKWDVETPEWEKKFDDINLILV